MVALRVSHPNLENNIRAGVNVGIEVAGDIKHRLELQKKTNDRALKDIYNKLDVGSAKFKPSRSGLKVIVGLASKDNCEQQKPNLEGLKRGEVSGPSPIEYVGLSTGPSTS